jgi:hypothetical protein
VTTDEESSSAVDDLPVSDRLVQGLQLLDDDDGDVRDAVEKIRLQLSSLSSAQQDVVLQRAAEIKDRRGAPVIAIHIGIDATENN